MSERFVKVLIYAAFLCAPLATAGCGGGGSRLAQPQEMPPQPEPPQPPPVTLPPPQAPPASQPPAVTPDCIETAEYGCIDAQDYDGRRQEIEDAHNGEEGFVNQWGLGAVRADRAWAQLELELGAGAGPGSGITVGLIDTGIDAGHPVFAGKTVTEHFFSGAEDEDGAEPSHGTAVAGVIAGRPGDAFATDVNAGRGVAWGADIAMFAIPVGSSGDVYDPVELSALGSVDDREENRFATVIDWPMGGGALDFVNVSVSYQGIIEQFSERQLRDGLGDSIAALAQDGANEKTVFVWSGGNAHGDDCDAADFTGNPDLCVNGKVDAKSVEVLAGLPARIAELRGHMISVVATSRDGEIASFSNRCGIAEEWCLAAPGAGIRTAWFGPGDDGPGSRGAYTASGTSFAAPMVTGGLAVMKHYFRGQLSNTALVSRLLATADKGGVYADGSVYGQGLMDLAAATSPVGVTSVALGGAVGGPASSLAETRLSLGNALGDGLGRALSGQEVAAFDELGGPFWFPLGEFIGAAGGLSMEARLRSFMAPPRVRQEPGTLRPAFTAFSEGDESGRALWAGLTEAPPPGGGHLSLVGRALTLTMAGGDGLGVTAFSSEGTRGETAASGAALYWRPFQAPFELRSGLVAEHESLLGSTAGGAFGRVSGDSAFVGIEGNGRIGAWRVNAAAEIGTVRAATRGGMLASIAPLTTSAFAFAAERPLAEGNTLSFSVLQPLRVEAGRASLSVPVGRTTDGRVLRRSLTADLEPAGRQIDAVAQWRKALSGNGELRLGAGWTWQPGHDAGAGPDLSLLAGWVQSF